jgi:hypothetical protein
MSATLKHCLIIFAMTVLHQIAGAQGVVWPKHYHIRFGRAPIKEGFIVLTQGDTLKGSIMVLAINPDSYPILVSGAQRVQEVFLPNIAHMRIFDGKGGWPYFDYINLHFTWFLWRLDGKKKDVAIYDDTLRGGDHHRVILVTPTTRVRIYNGQDWAFNNSWLISRLTRFINRRYHAGVKKEDFKSTQDIFDYILDKENALLDSLTIPNKSSPQ